MRPVRAAALVLVLLGVGLAYTGARDRERAKAWERQADSVMGLAKAMHDHQTAVLRDSLLIARTEQALAVGRAARAEAAVRPARVVVTETKAALPVVDAGLDSGRMIRARDEVIAAQDTVIERQAVLVVTLTEVIRADSGIARLYVRQREVDSLRIGALESTLASRPHRRTLLGLLPLPRVRCGVGMGIGVSLAGTNVQAGPIAGCLLTY